jgi:3-mercaptopyruvate sulfurtransferase SseA
MSLLSRAALLSVAGGMLGLAANAVSPRPARVGAPVVSAAESSGGACASPQAGAARISVEEAKPLCAACTAVFVDARSAEEYAKGHVAGALHLAAGESTDALLPALRAALMVVVYDRDGSCAAADQVAALLQSKGVRDVRVLTGAWPEWVAEGGAGESGGCALCSAGARR